MLRHLAESAAHCVALKARVRYLAWDVQIEMLEVVAAMAGWALWANLWGGFVPVPNGIYRVMFLMVPRGGWVAVIAVSWLAGLIGLIGNRPRLRCASMFALCLIFTAVTLLVRAAVPYALAWEWALIFALSAGWAHVRLRREIAASLVKRRKAAPCTPSQR